MEAFFLVEHWCIRRAFLLQELEHLREGFFHRDLELHLLACRRVDELNLHRLQQLRRSHFENLRGNFLHQRGHAVQTFFTAIIQRVADYRVARIAAMHTNLVRASRFKL